MKTSVILCMKCSIITDYIPSVAYSSVALKFCWLLI